MGSLDIFVENINRLAVYHHLDTYADIAQFLNVTEDSIKRWQNKTRCPSLKKIDQMGDRIGCHSYALIQKSGEIFAEIEFMQNNSREILLRNLQEYFMQAGRFSWNDKAALFYGKAEISSAGDSSVCAGKYISAYSNGRKNRK